MITVENMLSIDKSSIPEAANTLNKEDIPQLVEWLESKDDAIRYHALLLLQNRSHNHNDVYPFWEVFKNKLGSDNSYQRSIGIMLLADNVRWDVDNKMDETIDEYLLILNDEKPITVRQTIQALSNIVANKAHLNLKISERLRALDLANIRDTMRKSVLTDILSILIMIRKDQPSADIDNYISNALTGEILDKKTKKKMEAMI